MKLKHLFFAIAALPILVSCEKDVAITGILVDPSTVTITEAGGTANLTATIAPLDAKANVVWASSNTAIATVTGSGLTAVVTAVGNGTAKISASADIFTAECAVTVNIGSTGGGGAGSKEEPYVAEDVISKSTGNKDKIDVAGIWAKGYIVGRYNSTTKQVDKTDTEGFNIMLASSASETNMSKMICVQLPAGDIRTGLGLVTNLALLGKEVKVHGDITTYNTLPGVKNTDGYWLTEANIGINPPEVGNFNVPVLSIADLTIMYKGSDVTLAGTNKIVGVITTDLVGGNSTSKKNLVVTSENNLSGIAIRFSDKDNTFAMGDKVEVLLNGKLTEYAGQLQLSVALVMMNKLGTAKITPRVATIAEINANIKAYNFCVVTTQGTFSGPKAVYGDSNAHVTNKLADGSQSLDVFVAKYSNFVASTMPTTRVTVTGIAQSFGVAPAVTSQIIIRNLDDVK